MGGERIGDERLEGGSGPAHWVVEGKGGEILRLERATGEVQGSVVDCRARNRAGEARAQARIRLNREFFKTFFIIFYVVRF